MYPQNINNYDNHNKTNNNNTKQANYKAYLEKPSV